MGEVKDDQNGSRIFRVRVKKQQPRRIDFSIRIVL